MIYLYALVDAPPAREARGLDGAPIACVRAGALWAATSAVAAAPPVGEAALRAHDAAVRALHDATSAVLPVRFGAAFADEESLASALSDRAPTLASQLRRVTNCLQMTLRLFSAPVPVSASASVSGLSPTDSPGTTYLRSRSLTHVFPPWEHARAALAPFIRDERVERHDTPPLVASVFHLLARADHAAYAAALASLDSPSLRIVASGPHPPYAFAEALA